MVNIKSNLSGIYLSVFKLTSSNRITIQQAKFLEILKKTQSKYMIIIIGNCDVLGIFLCKRSRQRFQKPGPPSKQKTNGFTGILTRLQYSKILWHLAPNVYPLPWYFAFAETRKQMEEYSNEWVKTNSASLIRLQL